MDLKKGRGRPIDVEAAKRDLEKAKAAGRGEKVREIEEKLKRAGVQGLGNGKIPPGLIGFIFGR